MSDCDEGDVETCAEHQARYPAGRCEEKDCPCCDRVKATRKKAAFKTVCAGCGEKDGAHAETCKDLDGIRIRLEKRVAELEAAMQFNCALDDVLNACWNEAIEAAALSIADQINDGVDADAAAKAIRNLKKGK